MNDYPRYDPHQTYRWNYEHAPDPVDVDVPEMPGDWSFCGRRVPSPLGIPAGPLLNGKWLLYYASLGFDILTYKTVRSSARECYPLPNLQPVHCGQLAGGETSLPAQAEMTGSWAVSFGMPSAKPDVWRKDIEQTRAKLSPEKILSVSVVATEREGWGMEELAADYALCAKWAVESGADSVETNFSCPNVCTSDGQLYQSSHRAGEVAASVREAIGEDVPYLVKIGHVNDEIPAALLLEAIAPYVSGIAMTNSVAATVEQDGELMFDGQKRGICGDATRAASLRQTELFSRLIANRGLNLALVGVGGASTAEHVRAYLNAGAEQVHIASAAMTDPGTALAIKQTWAKCESKEMV
jgi:dihydroorotate dehydrogenase (NAD+) catalytic subunit